MVIWPVVVVALRRDWHDRSPVWLISISWVLETKHKVTAMLLTTSQNNNNNDAPRNLWHIVTSSLQFYTSFHPRSTCSIALLRWWWATTATGQLINIQNENFIVEWHFKQNLIADQRLLRLIIENERASAMQCLLRCFRLSSSEAQFEMMVKNSTTRMEWGASSSSCFEQEVSGINLLWFL